MRKIWLLLASLLFIGNSLPLIAQDGDTVITLAVSEFLKDAFSDELFAQFKAENPGVQVKLVTSTRGGAVSSPADDIAAHLQGLKDYAESADVLLVSGDNLSIESIRAGLFMDLSPIVNADTDLNPDDFLPAAWESFQWDRGIWALPVAADVLLMLYNPAAFDAAGIAYPSESWTLDDFAIAVRALMGTNADGETEPGYFDFGTSRYLLRSLLGSALYDGSNGDVVPDFSNPELINFLTTWHELQDTGAIGGFTSGGRFIAIGGGVDEGPPLTIQRSFGMGIFPGDDNVIPASGSLLPGGAAGLDIQGFAISAGTRYPEQAYALAEFLTHSVEVANGLFGSAPARRSLQGVVPEASDDGPEREFTISSLTYPPESQAVIDAGFVNAIPHAEMLFVDYVMAALQLMESEGLDAAAALQQVEANVYAGLDRAAAFGETVIINVATPIPEVPLASGEIALDFGIASFINPLPNQQLWDKTITEFVANDPQIGRINLATDFQFEIANMAANYDCFYMPSNAVPGGNLNGVISLDPFIDADPAFDKDDIVGGALQQVQFDNRTWALPIVIQPEILRYNPTLFDQAGVPLPETGWTVDQFVDALRRLKPTADDPTPFIPRDINGQFLHSLINAFGGLPIDYRTNPPTINFTNPATVDAIQQVLDLAKAGYIEYNALAEAGVGFDVSVVIGGSEDEDAIYTHTLSAFSFFTVLDADGQIAQDGYRFVPYPHGTQYTPITFDVGTTFISENAADPDACYRWLSALSRQPGLFSAMPARRSLINDPQLTATNDPDLTALYQQIDAILNEPGVIIGQSAFRPGSGSPSAIFQQFWLNRAFDRYVLEEADLATELAAAEQFTRDYLQCAASIADENPTTPQANRVYFQKFGDCAISVDPTVG